MTSVLAAVVSEWVRAEQENEMSVRVRRLHMITPSWHEHMVWLWQEDDASRAAGDESREMLPEAWRRIVGRDFNKSARLAVYDAGDAIYEFHQGGWVCCHSFDGDYIGVSLTVEITAQEAK